MEKNGNQLVNTYIKIRNPLMLRPNSVNHECNPDDFEFKSQQKKYDLLKASLEPYNIVLTKVYATRWASADNHGKINRYSFVVESDSPIVWHKYEAESYCSSQNYIYFGKRKMLLNKWLNGTQEFRNQIINEMINNQ
jgi:hypothetical protein